MKITRLAEGGRTPECNMEVGRETNMKPACAQLSPVTLPGTATTTCPSSEPPCSHTSLIVFCPQELPICYPSRQSEW